MNRCDYAPRHLPTVVFTRRIRDLFAKRYWVLCWKCDLRLGPFPDRGFALFVQADIDSDPGAGYGHTNGGAE